MPRRERNEDRPQVEKKNMSAFVVFPNKSTSKSVRLDVEKYEKKKTKCHQKHLRWKPLAQAYQCHKHQPASSQAFGFLWSWKTLGWNTMQPTVWGRHSSTAIFCKDFVTAATLSEDAESSLLGNILSTLGQDYDYSRNSAQAQIHANRANSVWARLHAWNLVHPKAAPSKGNRHRTLTPMFKG